MKKSTTPATIVIIGAFLFNLLFWNEKQGLNILLFDIFIVAALWRLDKTPFSTPSVKITVGGTLLAAGLIVFHNSLFAKFIHVLSFATMIGMLQQRELRFFGFAFIQYFINWLAVPIQIVRQITLLPILREQKKVGRQLSGAWMTILILPVFYLIYYFANAKFAELSNRIWQPILNLLTLDIHIERVLFFILGVFMVGALVWKQTWFDFLKKDAAFDEALTQPESIEDDELTYRNAFNLIVSLNILLFINNLIDVRYVWFGDVSGKTALELKEYVHEGTYILIFGIVLAITIILWLFRDSLNFVDNAKQKLVSLRGVTTLWLAQNALLALSVGVRNGQYINYYGLAYKRIGVFIFLILVLYGLRLLYLKIKGKHTFFFFIRRGAYALYAVLMAASLINWDVFITQFNINQPSKSGSIDVRFLVDDVSDKNLYLLFTHVEQLALKIPQQAFPDSEYRGKPKLFATDEERLVYLKTLLNNKKLAFEEAQKHYSWLSWNYADYVNRKFLGF